MRPCNFIKWRLTTPTVNVDFGSGSAGSSAPFAKPWLDDTLNLDADGNVLTNFYGQAEAWFLLQLEPGYVVDKVYCSYGMVSDHGQVLRPITQEGAVWSVDDPEVELNCYPAGAVDVAWIGNTIELSSVSGRTLAAADDPLEGIARADLSYSARAYLFCWHNPNTMELEDGEDYPAEICITVKEA